MHSTEKVRDSTLDDESALQHVTSVVVMVLYNQPEAFASDLGDDESLNQVTGHISFIGDIIITVCQPSGKAGYCFHQHLFVCLFIYVSTQ